MRTLNDHIEDDRGWVQELLPQSSHMQMSGWRPTVAVLLGRIGELEDQNLVLAKENNDLKAKLQDIHDAVFNALRP